MFPRAFIFGVIIPLDLVELSSLVARDSVLLVVNIDVMCLVSQIGFQWDGIFDNNTGRRFQTSFELGDVEHIMYSQQCHTRFLCQNQVLIVCMIQNQLFHTYGPKVFTYNQMLRIKYNYSISNVSKDYDDSQQNGTMEDSITAQEQQPGQHVT
jgi:hypothetical protein